MPDSKYNSDSVAIAKELLQHKSLTPDDAGCQDYIREYLSDLGFEITDMSSGNTTNTWAVKKFTSDGPTFLFAGHTDVVAPGNIEKWQLNGQSIEPFDLTEIDGRHYGRGIADMKGGLAAMLSATATFMNSDAAKNARGIFAFLITSDEEGAGVEGTSKLVQQLSQQGVKVEYCLVGESSSLKTLGDRVYYGRRGSHSLDELKIKGIVGHVAHGNGVNASAIVAAIVSKAYQTAWDDTPNPDFDPTVFEVTEIASSSRIFDNNKEISAGENVVPDEATIRANWRYNPSTSPEKIEKKFMQIVHECFEQVAQGKLDTDGHVFAKWINNGDTFQTGHDSKLLKVTQQSIESVLGSSPALSTSGGTSDGRFIAPAFGADVIELGMVGDTIHCPNENVKSTALGELAQIYVQILSGMLTS
ncbi:succinyl-diaminopimelate desuccinylase [Candidatus Saccharibacteria bacterium]|nr:succinyl-diaminopimelate desuccinylase [Candidatus Saccharibacteria bacterium]